MPALACSILALEAICDTALHDIVQLQRLSGLADSCWQPGSVAASTIGAESGGEEDGEAAALLE